MSWPDALAGAVVYLVFAGLYLGAATYASLQFRKVEVGKWCKWPVALGLFMGGMALVNAWLVPGMGFGLGPRGGPAFYLGDPAENAQVGVELALGATLLWFAGVRLDEWVAKRLRYAPRVNVRRSIHMVVCYGSEEVSGALSSTDFTDAELENIARERLSYYHQLNDRPANGYRVEIREYVPGAAGYRVVRTVS